MDNIPTARAQEGRFEITISSIGILDAAVKKSVTSAFSGKIVKLLPEGTFVKKGEPLIWMDTSDLEDKRKEYETEVELARTTLAQKKEVLRVTKVTNQLALEAEKARVDFQGLKLEDARLNYEKQKVLVAKNLAAKSSQDDARIAMLQAELSLKQARINLKKLAEDQTSDEKIKQSNVESAQVELERRQRQLDEVLDKIDKAVIKANGQGNISYATIWKGGKMGKVAEGDQTWRRATLMEIPDPSTMQALIPISEIDVGKIQIGQKVEVTVDALPGQVYAGAVESKGVVPISSTRRPFGLGGTGPRGKEFEVRIKLDHPDEKFRQGMTVSVRISIEKIKETLYIPQEAVFGEGKDRYVFVKKDGGYEKLPITVGSANANYIVVKSGVKTGAVLFLRDPTKKLERVGALEGLQKRPESLLTQRK